jgi:hypothetical protein
MVMGTRADGSAAGAARGGAGAARGGGFGHAHGVALPGPASDASHASTLRWMSARASAYVGKVASVRSPSTSNEDAKARTI